MEMKFFCPVCRNNGLTRAGDRLVCTACNAGFNIKNNLYSFTGRSAYNKIEKLQDEIYSANVEEKVQAQYEIMLYPVCIREQAIVTSLDKFNVTPEDTVLEIGCRDGQVLHYIGKKTGCTCLGLDISEKNLNYISKLNPGNKYLVANADNIPLPDSSIDKVICFELLEHVKDKDGVLREVHRVLKKSGLAIISFPKKNNIFTCRHLEENIFRKEALKKLKMEWGHLPELELSSHEFEALSKSNDFEILYKKNTGIWVQFIHDDHIVNYAINAVFRSIPEILFRLKIIKSRYSPDKSSKMKHSLMFRKVYGASVFKVFYLLSILEGIVTANSIGYKIFYIIKKN